MVKKDVPTDLWVTFQCQLKFFFKDVKLFILLDASFMMKHACDSYLPTWLWFLNEHPHIRCAVSGVILLFIWLSYPGGAQVCRK